VKRGMTLFLIMVFMSFVAWGRTKAVIKTNFGDIRIILYDEAAPATVANFVRYAEEGLYDGILIHRILRGFVIQSGGYYMSGGLLLPVKTYTPVASEADNGLYNIKGTLAMARVGRDPDSATSQFFINMKTNTELNYKGEGSKPDSYTVFGRVVSGWEALKQIENVRVGRNGPFEAFPLTDAIIHTVRIEREEDD